MNARAGIREPILPRAKSGLPPVLTLAGMLSLVIMVIAGSVRAEDAGKLHLFNVVSVRDEIVIGLSEAEVPALASRAPVAVLADMLASSGRLAAWRFAPARGEDGVVRLMPILRVVIFAAATVRLEPYSSEQEVVAPAQ